MTNNVSATLRQRMTKVTEKLTIRLPLWHILKVREMAQASGTSQVAILKMAIETLAINFEGDKR